VDISFVNTPAKEIEFRGDDNGTSHRSSRLGTLATAFWDDRERSAHVDTVVTDGRERGWSRC
jgi:hypothetical protein